MMQDGDTVPFRAVPGTACALCEGTSLPALMVPVVGPGLVPGLPGVCQSCLSVILKISFQLMSAVTAEDRVAALVIATQDGRKLKT